VPIYEYRCPNGHTFEVLHRITDPDPEACEICGASPIVKVLHPVPIHFKGSGFYSTDYGRGSRKREAESDGGGVGKKEEKKESKPEQKAAADSGS
jgi:putative FmdB family regulatory protein